MSFINNFEQTLKDFFFQYHPRQIKKVPQLISEFKGQEKEVMLLLCKKYKVNPDSIEGLNTYTPPVIDTPAPIVESTIENTIEEESKVEEVETTTAELEETEKTEEKKEKKKKNKE